MAKYQVSTFYKGQGSGFIINGDFNSVLDKMQKHFLKLNKKAQFKQNTSTSWHILENGKTIGKFSIEPIKQTQDKMPLSFMDSVVRAFRDETPKVTLQMIKRLIGSNRNQMGGAETDSLSVGNWEISGNKEKHFSKWNYYYEAQNTKTGAHKRSGDASEILQFIKSRS